MVQKASGSPGIILTLLKERKRLARPQTGMVPKSYENHLNQESKKSLRNTSMMVDYEPQFKSSFQKKAQELK